MGREQSLGLGARRELGAGPLGRLSTAAMLRRRQYSLHEVDEHALTSASLFSTTINHAANQLSVCIGAIKNASKEGTCKDRR